MALRTPSGFAGLLSSTLIIAAAVPAAAAAVETAYDPLSAADFEFDVDAWCESDHDVFALDGDGLVYHYWRNGGGLQEVRRLHVNPDVELCAVGPRRVFFHDPAFGVLAFDRSPEAQPLIRPVYVQPPAGRGSIVPEGFELEQGPTGPVLRIHGQGRELRLAPPAPPARLAAPLVPAAVETEPVDDGGDAADDSVILVGSDSAWILGTDKQAGLRAYNLEGRQQDFLPVGRLNNVDALPLGDDRFLVAASNRSTIAVDLFEVDTRPFRILHRQSIPLALEDPYGLCMGLWDGAPHVFVGDTAGTVQAWRLEPRGAAQHVHSWTFDSQTEGCVFDGVAGRLYVGEETAGIWSIDPDSGERRLLHAVDGEILVADVEGLDIYEGNEGRYLLASSQGDDSFVVYSLPDYRRLLKFRVGADRERGIDGASETDGIAVTPRALDGYPAGLLVVQDGYNVAPGENQNFKFVDWRAIQSLLEAGAGGDAD
jgi:3-phytase